ncbi:MAG: signal peptidase I [Pseudomonadota bacterium]|nr:signal peptidase I [Pseudomonadota bacterium]
MNTVSPKGPGEPLSPQEEARARAALKKTSGHSSFYDTVRTIVLAVLLALLIRTFAYEPFSIPSGSMFPTLLTGDYLFVSKFSYGYSRYSLPAGIPLIENRIMASSPKRGDVAVFKLPSDGRTDYIKRVIGLPGDRIQVVDGVLHINFTPVTRQKEATRTIPGATGTMEVTEYTETLPGGVSHRIWERSDNAPLDNTPVYTVPPGHYFMMGDNRDNSTDSRVLVPYQVQNDETWNSPSRQGFVSDRGVGFVPSVNLVGRADLIFFSLGDGTHFWELWKWPWSLRFSRLFRPVG